MVCRLAVVQCSEEGQRCCRIWGRFWAVWWSLAITSKRQAATRRQAWLLLGPMLACVSTKRVISFVCKAIVVSLMHCVASNRGWER